MSAAAESVVTPQPLAVGQRVMWYEVEEVLSSDPFGITYRARNTQTRSEPRGEYAPVVAIRELLPHELAVRGDFSEVQLSDPARADVFADARARFVNEAKTLSTLNHPAVMRVHFQRRMNATAYMVMEYLSGQNLRGWLEQGVALSESELLAWFDPLLDGLAEVHRRGLLHANLNTNSVWVRDDERLVLTGFGSAQLAYLRALREPLSGLAPGYAAIEQYAEESGHQGTWTDVYGLAAIMYRVVTGYRPADALERLTAAQEGAGDPQHSALELARGKYSEALLGTIDAALSLNLAARPQDMAHLKAALHGEAVATPATPSTARTHDDVLFGTAQAVSRAPVTLEPVAEAPVVEAEAATTPSSDAPGPDGFGAELPLPEPLAQEPLDQVVPRQTRATPPVTAKSAVQPAPLRTTVTVPNLNFAGTVETGRKAFVQQLARFGSFVATASGRVTAAGGSRWRRMSDGMSVATSTVARWLGQQAARVRWTIQAHGQQAQRTEVAMPLGSASQAWMQRAHAVARRVEQATGMSSARLLGVLAAGISVVVVAGMLVSTFLPGDTSQAGATQAQLNGASLTVPSLADRHYARATRLLDEARQAKRAGELTQARYLAATALNIRPGYADAEAFLNEL